MNQSQIAAQARRMFLEGTDPEFQVIEAFVHLCPKRQDIVPEVAQVFEDQVFGVLGHAHSFLWVDSIMLPIRKKKGGTGIGLLPFARPGTAQ